MSKLVLVVDDEKDLVNTLDYNLQREGYQTRLAYNGADALRLAQDQPPPDIVLLDIMLPDMSGTEVCRQLRQNDRTRNIPVIMLTAKGEEIDRVVGFEVGADDYVVKPFSTRELLLRIRAVGKRAESTEKEPAEQTVTFGRLKVNLSAHRTWIEGEEVVLTALEFKLLTTLLTRRGRVQSREQLLTDVWGLKPDITTRTVDTHVKRLRQKITTAGGYIQTLRGVGYRFADDPDAEIPPDEGDES